MENLSKGTVLGGQWRVKNLLGEGACGKVYTVDAIGSLNSGLNYEVVAKVIPLGGGGKGKADKAQERLANTLHYEYTLYMGVLYGFPCCSQLPLKFYGDDLALRVRYLVMEKMDMDLLEFSKRGGFTVADIAEIGLQILTGLRWLHDRHFLFVDVKPDNFMLKDNKLHFIDFGLVTRMSSAQSVQQQPGERLFEGTPSYSSVAADNGDPACGRDDIEALGYVLLSLFSNGHLPWTDSESDTELHRKKADCDIKALAKQCNAEEVGKMIVECRAMSYTEKVNYNKFEEYLNQMKQKKNKPVATKSLKQDTIVEIHDEVVVVDKNIVEAPPSRAKATNRRKAEPTAVVEEHLNEVKNTSVAPKSLKRASTKEPEKEVVEAPIQSKATTRRKAQSSSSSAQPVVIDLSPPSPPAKRPTRRSNAKTGTDNDKSSGPFSSHQPDAHIDNIDEFSAMQLNEVTPSIAARVAEKRRSSNGPFTTDPLHITTLEIEEHGVKRKRQHELKLSKNECEKVFCIGREIDENDFALPSDESVSGRHMKVRIHFNGDIYIKDEKSTNCTYLNEVKLGKNWEKVTKDNTVKIGDSTLKFYK